MRARTRKINGQKNLDPPPNPEELAAWVNEVFDELERIVGIEPRSAEDKSSAETQTPGTPTSPNPPTQLPLL